MMTDQATFHLKNMLRFLLCDLCEQLILNVHVNVHRDSLASVTQLSFVNQGILLFVSKVV